MMNLASLIGFTVGEAPCAALVNDFSLELTPYLIVYSDSKPDKAV